MRTLPDDTMPAIDAQLAGGGGWHIADEQPQMLALLVFYRGLQCPICRKWLRDLERLLPEFERRGVSVIALSTDTRARAERAKRDWGLAGLRV
ncbi:MAG TPA: redoxin domain-containing protein, partial [Burkholderiales bacterium]|nr:redoxin domain-containing protein [Burkholderiales bacterium]